MVCGRAYDWDAMADQGPIVCEPFGTLLCTLCTLQNVDFTNDRCDSFARDCISRIIRKS